DPRRLLRVGQGADLEVVLWLGDLELGEEALRQQRVVVLTGVNDDVLDTPVGPEGAGHGRELDEVGPSPHDGDDAHQAPHRSRIHVATWASVTSLVATAITRAYSSAGGTCSARRFTARNTSIAAAPMRLLPSTNPCARTRPTRYTAARSARSASLRYIRWFRGRASAASTAAAFNTPCLPPNLSTCSACNAKPASTESHRGSSRPSRTRRGLDLLRKRAESVTILRHNLLVRLQRRHRLGIVRGHAKLPRPHLDQVQRFPRTHTQLPYHFPGKRDGERPALLAQLYRSDHEYLLVARYATKVTPSTY